MSEATLREYDADEEPTREIAEDRENFRVQDDQQAAWAMRKLAYYRARQRENSEVATREIDRIQEWLGRVNESLDNNTLYFEALLADYAQRQRRDHDRKTVDTPYGRVKSRQGQAKFHVIDGAEFIAWAEQNRPDLLSVKVTADLRALKDAATPEDTPTMGRIAVTDGGEVIPGVTFEPPQVTFTFETE